MTCRKCGGPLPPKGRGRPRVMCMDCSPRKGDRSRSAPRAPLSLVADLPVAPPAEPPGSVAEAASRELVAAGVESTTAGMAALVLAAAIDAHGATPSPMLAGMVRQLQATVAEALSARTGAVADDLDLILADA